jgi:hypothetical protein
MYKINATSVPHHTDKAKNLHYLHFLHRPSRLMSYVKPLTWRLPPPRGPLRAVAICVFKGTVAWDGFLA